MILLNQQLNSLRTVQTANISRNLLPSYMLLILYLTDVTSVVCRTPQTLKVTFFILI